MFRPLISLLFALFLAGCDLFPVRNEEQNAALYHSVLAQLNALERDGLLNPNTASIVLVSRHGTSFGGTITLAGEGAEGRAMNAEQMTQHCLTETRSQRTGAIKRCLRTRFRTDDELRYSHGGIAIKLPGRDWTVRQSLRDVNTGEHFQWYGTLESFVDIPLVKPRIELMVPDLDLQNRLASRLLIERAGNRIIDPDYNLVSQPFQTDEQMSNQFVLELVASALQSPGLSASRANAQAYLRAHGFRPSVILLGGIQTVTKLDSLFGTIDLSNQPYARRYEVGEMITVLSIRKFLQGLGRLSTIRDVTVAKDTPES